MALGISTASSNGDIKDRIQYDARAGRFFRIDRVNADGQWTSTAEELPLPLRVVMDLGQIEVGWQLIKPGQVDMQMVRLGEERPAKPSADHKEGFRVDVYSKALGVRTFGSTAKTVIGCIDRLHDAYEEQKGAHPGCVPVVAFTSTTPITTGQGAQKSTNYAPVAEIAEWIPRPEGMDEGGASDAPAAAPAAAQPATQAAAQPAPAAAGQEF